MSADLKPKANHILAIVYPVSALCFVCSQLFAADGLQGVQSRRLAVQSTGRAGFTSLPGATTGIFFTNRLSDAAAENNRILENGSGAALGDVDGDGRCDIYFCRLEGPNALYRNLGDWRFEEIAAKAGVACPDQFSTGAVFADLDGDGDLDLLVNSLGRGTRSFRNDGQGLFLEDQDSGLIRKYGSTSMALADLDGDGDLDLYVANYRTTTIRDNPAEDFEITAQDGKVVARPPERFDVVTMANGEPIVYEKGEPDILYLNDGQGHFSPVSWTDGRFVDEAGAQLTAAPRHWGLTVALRDFSGDGAPDIYVCNDFIDSPDDVWINDGHGRFRRIARLALRHTSWSSMAVDFADINRDGLLDFLVVDMLSRQHRLRQTQRANTDMASVGIRIGEIDNRPQYLQNTLFLNRGDGTFAEIAQLSGLQASEWSWSPVFLDVDLDGYEDVLITNGNAHDLMDADAALRAMAKTQGISRKAQPKTLLLYPPLKTANLAFRNRGDLTFEEVGREWGFDTPGVSQGMALGDLDNDGDLDVAINNLNSAAGLYRNEFVAPRLAVRLRGQAPNRQAIGSKIKVSGGPVSQTQEVICGGRYVSGDDPLRVFAAGGLTNRLTIEVTWRSGERSVVRDAQPNGLYEISEPISSVRGGRAVAETGNRGDREGGKGRNEETEGDRIGVNGARQISNSKSPIANGKSNHISRFTFHPPPFFQDVSHLIRHSHHESGFDDFARQPLLPHRFSQLGPGVAWSDLNGDRWDDLVIGTGRGGELAVFQNDGRGGFKRRPNSNQAAAILGDQTSVLAWQPAKGPARILAGLSNYEGGETSAPSVIGFDVTATGLRPAFELVGQSASVGPMALADVDGDGDLDLFVGNRLMLGRYPEPATSRLFRNEQGEFRLDLKASRVFVDAGLVSGAIFTDLDADGAPDLVLACDWGPVKAFRNIGGKFSDRTDELGLAAYPGRWNGVAAGDFDGDGRIDIVATNWGRNTKYQRHLKYPLRLYCGDFDGNGTLDIVEAYVEEEMDAFVPWRGLVSMSRAIPSIRDRVPSFRAYASADLREIIGKALDEAAVLEVMTLESMIFLNRSGHFEASPLPIEAQFAPAFGVNIADMDGDGNEDVFLSQNFFAVHPETSRYDAGRGLWLKGNGHGAFTPMTGPESGVLVYGEQRGSALADYDGDGRVDLVVTQNGAATKLFRNQRARSGLRIELKGPPLNPTGMGAVIRLIFGSRLGPAREIHAGGGYWSQDSAVQVMTGPEPPTGVWVRWPWGTATTASLPIGARQVRIYASGRIETWM
ncbi:MAG: VCBS repeat-containing protein [Verrucomicrobia bacterium]|nr:VCBS repeat-containing protein [Verrucomicrobiota bacterium]